MASSISRSNRGNLLRTVQRIRIGMFLGISLILIGTFVTAIVNFRTSKSLDSNSAIVNQAGRQRMLSQRIVLLRLKNRLPETSESHSDSVAELRFIQQEFQVAHARLKELALDHGWDDIHRRLSALDSTVMALASRWELDSSGMSHAQAAELYLPEMNRIVSDFEQATKRSVSIQRMVTLCFSAVVLFSVLPIWTFVMNPFLKRAQESASEAQRVERAKSEFFANMSHEIRTPMTAILGFADVILDDLNGEEWEPQKLKDSVATIRSNGRHLLTIINDILDMSKIEAGKLTIEKSSVEVRRIVEEVSSLLRPMAIEKGIELNVLVHEEVPTKICSDTIRLKQIVLNLVGNAIKFTSKGHVSLELSVDSQRDQLRLEVFDTGIGMTPRQLESVRQLNAFTQADGSTTRRFGGTGLGLRISNSLAILLGGEMKIDSIHGSGSTFRVMIPIEQPAVSDDDQEPG